LNPITPMMHGATGLPDPAGRWPPPSGPGPDR